MVTHLSTVSELKKKASISLEIKIICRIAGEAGWGQGLSQRGEFAVVLSNFSRSSYPHAWRCMVCDLVVVQCFVCDDQT